MNLSRFAAIAFVAATCLSLCPTVSQADCGGGGYSSSYTPSYTTSPVVYNNYQPVQQSYGHVTNYGNSSQVVNYAQPEFSNHVIENSYAPVYQTQPVISNYIPATADATFAPTTAPAFNYSPATQNFGGSSCANGRCNLNR